MILQRKYFEKQTKILQNYNCYIWIKNFGALHAAGYVALRGLHGQVTWTYIETAHLTMRPFSPQFLGRYLAAAGPQVHQSVGAYQLDGLGIQLFDRVEGDYFGILGLPLLPLCARLPEQRVLAS